MNDSQARIRGLAGSFVFAAVVLLGYLGWLMVGQNELWSLRSHQNRWAFRAVPSLRGSILDRHGEVLVRDEATTRLSIYYERFRLRHPVGAAVHGATLLGELQPGGAGPLYAYGDGERGPEAAAAALLALPVRWLKRGALPKSMAAELGTLVTTVLSACSGLSRRAVFTAIREAATAAGDLPLGEVLPGGSAGDWLMAFAGSWAMLREFDAELSAAVRERTGATSTVAERVLLAELDRLRELSLLELRVQQRDEDGNLKLDQQGKPKLGDLYESIAWPFADQVPFELAARLRVGRTGQPGFEVLPAVRRVYHPGIGLSLRALLGAVQDVDKSVAPRKTAAAYLQRELPDDWLVDMVPDGVADSEVEFQRLHAGAQSSVERAVLSAGRRGINGVEAAFEPQLNGRLGMRLVERDARRRELQMWGAMQVLAGDPVQLTIDLQLQTMAEQVAADRLDETCASFPAAADRDRVEVGLCLMDARSGDILALAGAPVTPAGPRSIPGVGWRGNGAIGSVVKPLVMLELLQREHRGATNRLHPEFPACTGKVRIGGRLVGCAVGHGDGGHDAVRAIATSCNSFFFAAAEELGAAGLLQSMQRFGLRQGPPGSGVSPVQMGVPGLSLVPWRWVGSTELARRAIGYGVEASTVEIARAYAALATGVLPTVAIVRDPSRVGQPLAQLERECEVVRAGLRECVESGSAKGLPLLRQLGVHGKTGTAEVSEQRHNNAWFAGYLPQPAGTGVQLCFCAVVYWVPDGVHGAEAAAQMVEDLLRVLLASPTLAARYLLPEGGR